MSDNVSIRLEVADISNPASISVLSSFTIPSANYSELILDNEAIHVVGVSFDSGQAQTFILKYPLP
jgi:hypothetical protein